MLRYFDASILGNYFSNNDISVIVFLQTQLLKAFKELLMQFMKIIIKKLFWCLPKIFSLTFVYCVIIFVDHLFSFFVWEEWIIAGIIAQILAFESLFEVLTIPIISLHRL